MWVRFIADFDFRPPEKRRVCVAYKSGMVQFVRRICAVEAIKAGKAVRTTRHGAHKEPD